MALGSCGHRITHQLRPINMNGRSILSETSIFGRRIVATAQPNNLRPLPGRRCRRDRAADRVAIHRAPRHGALFYRRKLTPALLTAGHSPLAPRPTIVRVRRLCRALSRSQHTPPDTVNMLRDATFVGARQLVRGHRPAGAAPSGTRGRHTPVLAHQLASARGIRRVYHRLSAVAEFYASMRSIESVPFASVIVRTRPISMGAASSAAGSADWVRLSQASVPRRD
jgi:hypothetical protein